MVETEYKLVPSKEKGENKIEVPSTYGYGVRHVQGFIFFLSLAILYASRGHLGVSIVAMAMRPNVPTHNSTVAVAQALRGNIANLSDDIDVTSNVSLNVEETAIDSIWDIYRTYDWPKSTQEMVLGSFFLGYLIMMFPFGLICQKFGGKVPLQIALLVNTVATFIAPWLVAWGGWKALCACRVLQGLSQAGLYPALTTLLSNWVPISERGSLSSYVYTGSGIGTIAAFQLAGIMASSRFGWPSTFWLLGALCFLGFIIITVYGAATPATHRSISDEERNFIMGNISQRVATVILFCVIRRQPSSRNLMVTTDANRQLHNQKKSKTPWKSILTSVPAWATFTTHVGSAVCYVFYFTQVPTYMYAILKLNIRNSGLLSSIPYIAAFFSSIAFGYFSDFCTNKKIISIKTARLISNSIANVIPAICIALVSYTTSTVLAVLCFVVSLSSHAAMHTGWVVNYMDLSPNYSGALMAFGNTITNSFIVVLPILVSNVVTDVNDQLQWRIMMFLMSAFSIATNTVALFFMSAEVQPWNDNDETKEKDAEAMEVIKSDSTPSNTK